MATGTNPSSNLELGELLAAFEAEGYKAQMAARPAGYVLCMACQMESEASEMQVDAMERMEGASDPDDMLAVFALVCPLCRSYGTLVVGYGPDASLDDSDVLAALGDVDG
ncbi:MAG: hypothetical protein ACLGI2_15060 [Acidimicrobiia bacterium]